MRNTLRRLKRLGYMCLYHDVTHFSKLDLAIYNMGQRRAYSKEKKYIEDKIWLSAFKTLFPRASDR